MRDVLVATLVVLGALVVVGLAVIGVVMWRYKIPPRGVVAMFGALFYLVLPIDVLPEALLGPLGLVDDAGLVAGVTICYKLVKARQRPVAGGVLRPPPPR